MTRILLVMAALLAFAPAADAQAPPVGAPGATTDPASAVTNTTATLNGKVDPNGSATTYHFEYGTTTQYGTVTPDASAGEGDVAAPASADVTGLTANTTYHFRIVATNAGGTTNGADRTFKTALDPAPPRAFIGAAHNIGPNSALLRGGVDPNRADTTYRFEFGTTTRYGRFTPRGSAGSGDHSGPVSATVTGLRPFTRYHYRLTATNSAGTAVSGDRSFVTQRRPTAITLALAQPAIPWGGSLELAGRVQGAGLNGITVALERQDFPFAGPFSIEGTPAATHADRSGRFSFFLPAVFSATHLHAVTRSAISVTSAEVTPKVRVLVGAGTKRISKRKARIRGAVRPAVPDARVVLQRRRADGSWAFVRGHGVKALSGNRSRYSFKVKRSRHARIYRVKAFPRDDGAHASGISRHVRVRGRKR
jgi:hypothetical protein